MNFFLLFFKQFLLISQQVDVHLKYISCLVSMMVSNMFFSIFTLANYYRSNLTSRNTVCFLPRQWKASVRNCRNARWKTCWSCGVIWFPGNFPVGSHPLRLPGSFWWCLEKILTQHSKSSAKRNVLTIPKKSWFQDNFVWKTVWHFALN